MPKDDRQDNLNAGIRKAEEVGQQSANLGHDAAVHRKDEGLADANGLPHHAAQLGNGDWGVSGRVS